MVQKVFKRVHKIMPAPPKHWVGNGFNVYPVFAHLAFSEALSPWLMFDYAAPKHFEPTSKRLGVGQHPHRGFETITIAFQGGVEHQDSTGNNDVIGPGDVQWMTAGRGIIHEEYHSTAFAKSGGQFEMCQLWLNLPKKDKMSPPRYQPILASEIPERPLRAPSGEVSTCDDEAKASSSDGALVRIIAGEFEGTAGPAKTYSPVELWDLSLPIASKPVQLELPEGHTAILFVRRGELDVGAAGSEQHVGPQGVALLEGEGQAMRLVAREPGTQVLLLGGLPLDEPIAAQGPFVMNTREEIMQANMDFREGRMGR